MAGEIAMASVYRAGESQIAARPVVAYRPKTSPSRPGGMIRDKKVRLADWAGPTKAHKIRPKVQITLAPWARVANSAMVYTLMPASEPTINGQEPGPLATTTPATAVNTPGSSD